MRLRLFSCGASAAVVAAVGCGSDASSTPAADGGAPDAFVDAPHLAEASAPRDGASRDAPPADAASDAAIDAAPSPCPDGATLIADQSVCPAARPATPSGLASAAQAAARGDIVTLGGLAEDAVPCFPVFVCAPADAPALFFSDAPESPTSSGILYADTLGPGAFRIYVYHANGDSALRKFPVVLLNQGAADAHVVIHQSGIAPAPSMDYVGLGKAVAEAWLESTPGATVTVPAGQRVLFDPALDALHAANAELVHAIYDVILDAPVKISTVSVLAGDDAVALASTLPLLPTSSSGAGRGTFRGADVLVVGAVPIDASGVSHLRLGGGVVDMNLTGTDATTGAAVTLDGNFGVLYRLRFQASAPVMLGVAPRGTAWGGAAQVAPGADSQSPYVLLPSAQTSLSTTTDAILAGRFAAGSAPSGRLITAGGSNLPIDLVLAPLP